MPDSALYWYGNECNSLTGGWDNSGYKYSTDSINAGTKKTNSMYVYGGGTGVMKGFGTVSNFNASKFNKICFNCTACGTSTHNILNEVLANKADTAYKFLKQTIYHANEKGIKTVDISSINQMVYFITYTGNDTESRRNGYTYAVWLE